MDMFELSADLKPTFTSEEIANVATALGCLRECAEGAVSAQTGFATVHLPTALKRFPAGLSFGDKCALVARLESVGLFQTTFSQTWGRVQMNDKPLMDRLGALGIPVN